MKRIIIGNKLGKARVAIGEGLTTKINMIVGANNDNQETIGREKAKIDLGARLGVHTITDLSMIRLKKPLWQYVREKYPHIAVSMNPPYLPFVENGGRVAPSKLFEEIKRYVEKGGDCMTMNFVPATLADLKKHVEGRAIPITSRQGGILAKFMIQYGQDNPYYKIWSDLLPLLKKYHITVNIGSTFRPAGIAEAYDPAHQWEIKEQMKMYKLLDQAGIQSLVEIMSHQPLGQIGSGIIHIRRQYGSYVPFQLLGPTVTDIASGQYDYIASLIGAAEAARYNAGKVTVIPANEHVGFPTLKDLEIGIIGTKIAVHAGDLTRLPEVMAEDKNILKLRAAHKSCNPYLDAAGCNKCGPYCPLLLVKGDEAQNRKK
ncbi:hypothetical protein FJZ40_01550 [Candidatus Shapirobacteria bacterium]|nr:hypothetical protein [Candidatus Shapirobacteria bacterium]